MNWGFNRWMWKYQLPPPYRTSDQGQKPLQISVIRQYRRSSTVPRHHCSVSNTEKQSGPCVLFAESDLLTFVLCFSFMMILDSSTTHIGIVAFTVRERKNRERHHFSWEITTNYVSPYQTYCPLN